jgi:hypothetical protein
MKLLKATLAIFFVSISFAFANDNLEEKAKTERKINTSILIASLPKEITVNDVYELPAKQKEKTKKYTPEQKAAICGLELVNLKK